MNKLYLIILIFVPYLSFSQSWTFKSGGNPFDGKYRTASVLGTGSGLSKPILVVNKFEKDNEINLYVANVGYYSTVDDINLLWAFSNEGNNIYVSSVNLSDNQTFFFKSI